MCVECMLLCIRYGLYCTNAFECYELLLWAYNSAYTGKRKREREREREREKVSSSFTSKHCTYYFSILWLGVANYVYGRHESDRMELQFYHIGLTLDTTQHIQRLSRLSMSWHTYLHESRYHLLLSGLK